MSILIVFGLTGLMNTAQAQTNAYVTDPCSNGIFVIDTATNTVVTLIPFPLGSGPLGIALTPDGRRAYVTFFFPDSARGGLSVIDIETHTEIAHISSDETNGVGIGTTAVAITPDGTRAYVTDGGGVSVIDTATITVIASLPVGGTSPFRVAITPDSTRAYIVNRVSSSVSVIDTATNTVITTIVLATGSGPVGIAISPNGGRAYVANTDSGTISVIDTTTNTVTGTIQVGLGPTAIAITPDGKSAYVTNQDSSTVSVIATATNAVVATIPTGTGSGPTGVAITPDGSRAYVVTSSSGTVSVINTATNTIAATVPSLFCLTGGIAITPGPQVPTSIDQCKNGGYRRFGPPAGPFRNQGQCVSYVNRNRRGRT